jgi:dTDP-4-dehydrorhamnose reductase
MSKILITGATGLLGATLVPYLKKSGYNIATHARTGIADFLVDLADRDTSFEMLTKIQPSMIINLASLTSVELCQDEPNMAYLANTRTVENIAYWIQKTEANCHLIQISTDHVYDGAVLHTEDKITLTNIYAFSKYAGELAAARVPSSILRTNFIGRSKVSHRESLSDWVYTSLKNGKHVQVLDDVYFSPLFMNTLVEMIQFVIEKRPVGVFNLGSHNGMSKAGFAFAFAECLKLPTNTMTRIESSEAKFLKVYRPKGMRMDCSKFENTLGVKLPQLSDEIIRVAKEYDEVA